MWRNVEGSRTNLSFHALDLGFTLNLVIKLAHTSGGSLANQQAPLELLLPRITQLLLLLLAERRTNDGRLPRLRTRSTDRQLRRRIRGISVLLTLVLRHSILALLSRRQDRILVLLTGLDDTDPGFLGLSVLSVPTVSRDPCLAIFIPDVLVLFHV